MVQFISYPGYARGRHGRGDRCKGCHRLIGHGAQVVKDGPDWWHGVCWRLEEKVKATVAVVMAMLDGYGWNVLEVPKEQVEAKVRQLVTRRPAMERSG